MTPSDPRAEPLAYARGSECGRVPDPSRDRESLCENSGRAPLAHARGSACPRFYEAPNGTATVRERSTSVFTQTRQRADANALRKSMGQPAKLDNALIHGFPVGS